MKSKLTAIIVSAITLIALAMIGRAIVSTDEPAPYVEHHPIADAHAVAFGASAPRSPHWPTVRGHYIKDHPRCEACGTTQDLNVHHVQPFHEHPELELDPSNLITLCRQHHFQIGHQCSDGDHNWATCSNPRVREDAAKMRGAKR